MTREITLQRKILELAENCEINSVDLADVFCQWRNCHEAEIDSDGNISYTLQSDGYGWMWATDEQLAEFIEFANQPSCF